MSILDGILRGNSGDSSNAQESSNEFGSVIGTSPAFGLEVSDLLHASNSSQDGGSNGGSVESDSSDFTGLGHLGAGFSAPTLVGISSSSHDASVSESDGGNGGGLLNGLL